MLVRAVVLRLLSKSKSKVGSSCKANNSKCMNIHQLEIFTGIQYSSCSQKAYTPRFHGGGYLTVKKIAPSLKEGVPEHNDWKL